MAPSTRTSTRRAARLSTSLFSLASLAVLLLALPSLVSAAAIAAPHAPRASRVERSPTATWYQPRDHPAHALFARSGLDKRQSTAAVGSPEWRAAYPASTPATSSLPAQWVSALNAAVAAGQVPAVPQAARAGGGGPAYPAGTDPTSPQVCAASTFACRVPGDIWAAPEGTFGLNFDDGPLPASTALYRFLRDNNEHATHFFIGTNILANPDIFLDALSTSEDIAVHTWTHPYMTTLSNLEVVAQLGWTMQIIFDSTDGKLPRFWRPPYGDTDARVSNIAQYVFGMTTVMWNQDTDDWDMGLPGGPSPASIQANFERWLSGPKNPGLIVLEHELSADTVQAFVNAYPLIAQNGWTAVSIAEMFPGEGPYQNGTGNPAFGTPSASTTEAPPATSTSESATTSTAAATDAVGGSAASNSNGARTVYAWDASRIVAFAGGVLALLLSSL